MRRWLTTKAGYHFLSLVFFLPIVFGGRWLIHEASATGSVLLTAVVGLAICIPLYLFARSQGVR